MRRAYATVAILAMLMSPLTLLAGDGGGTPMCNRMCCVAHRSDSGSFGQPANHPMRCRHTDLTKSPSQCMCAMPHQQQAVYVFLAPLPPTALSVPARIVSPGALRQQIRSIAQASYSGFPLQPYQPPRS